jgi:hypothetical protein
MENDCTVRVKWNGGQPEDEQRASPSTFDELIFLLEQIRDRHGDEYGDEYARRLIEEGGGQPAGPRHPCWLRD